MVLNDVMFFFVSFIASIIGSICGIGGGIIIKPTLDFLGLSDVTTISFLSGCTILSMSIYNVLKSITNDKNNINIAKTTPLAIGAAIGGIVGKQIFNMIKLLFESQNVVGAVQSVCMIVITIMIVLYTIFKGRIKGYTITSSAVCVTIGVALGILSSFLGIGGGQMNLIVLFLFFGMDTKTAAANSLYIILFSQMTSLISTIVTKTVPDFNPFILVIMVLGGISGALIGRIFNKKLNNRQVDKLFMFVMSIVIFICVCNTIEYMKAL